MLPLGILEIAIFLFGMIIGSFLTVCVYRLPLGQSVVTPRSACPKCHHPIRWYDNVPLLSFLILRGRCRNCQASISPRYPVIEVTNGIGYLALYGHFGWGWSSVVYAMFFSALLTITWIDWDHQIIPDVITLPGILVGLLSAWLVLPVGFVNSLIGILVGGGILLLMAWISPFLFGKEGLGGGDIKLLAMVGAFLGWQHALGTLMIASVIGAVVGVGLMAVRVLKRGQYIPFGPYLALGAVLSLFYGSWMMEWYVGVIQ